MKKTLENYEPYHLRELPIVSATVKKESLPRHCFAFVPEDANESSVFWCGRGDRCQRRRWRR